MKNNLISVLLWLGLLVSSATAATVNVAESWSGTNKSGWVGYDLIREMSLSSADLFAVSNGALKVTFPSYLPVKSIFTGKITAIPIPMPPENYLIKAGSSASSGAFSGDYISNGVAAVRFRIYCEYPVEAWLAFQNETSGRWWQFSLGVQQTGSWQTVTVPVQPALFHELIGAKDWISFEQDVMNVSWIGVLLRRNSALNPQTVLLDDFTLIGPGADFATWMAQYTSQGVSDNVHNSLPDADLDGDGINNSLEFISGTSPVDSNDCLRVVIEPGSRNGPRLRWKVKPEHVYNVWRCTDLNQGFGKIGGDVAPQSDEAVYDDENGPNSSFYRIEVRQAP